MKNNIMATRTAFGEALAEMAKERKDIVVLDADVATSTKTSLFSKVFPDRFFEMGIAEQNMMGVAAGMASTQKIIPFAVTFAVFATKRACDQVSISIAYPKLNVKIVGSYGGVPTGKAGATHQAFEDIAIMRAIPNMTIVICYSIRSFTSICNCRPTCNIISHHIIFIHNIIYSISKPNKSSISCYSY